MPPVAFFGSNPFYYLFYKASILGTPRDLNSHAEASDPKSGASSNFATRA